MTGSSTFKKQITKVLSICSLHVNKHGWTEKRKADWISSRRSMKLILIGTEATKEVHRDRVEGMRRGALG